jgi:DNA-binding CsgD family transcriptional regulator
MWTRLRLTPASVGPESALEALDRLSGGALIVDARARVAHANRAAEAILARAVGLGTERDSCAPRLRAATPEQTRTLRRLIWHAAASRHDESPDGGGVLRLTSEAGGFLLASVSPLRAGLAWNAARRPAALVLLSAPDQDTAPSPEHLRALFGLTPAEAAVAGRIMRGDGIKAAARALRVAPNTVRTHLSRVFEKTETHRQAELVRLLQQVARLGEP